MLSRLARLVGSHPRRVLLAAFALLLVAAPIGGPVAGLLSTDTNDFADPGADSAVAADRLERAVGRSLTPGIVVLVRSAAPIASGAGRAKVRRVVSRIEADRAIARVVSVLGDSEARGRAARAAPAGRSADAKALVSRDGRSTYVAAFVRTGADGETTAERVERALEPIPGVLAGGFELAGPAVGEQVSKDLAKAELLAFPILLLLSLFIFRGAIAALLPLFVGLLAIMGTFLGLRIVNEAALLSIFALNLAIGLGLGLAIDYSLFVLSRYREEMARSGPGRDALARTLQTAGRTVVFSSLTVAAAMLALLVFPQRFLYSMAISGAITALMAGFVALTALPALLMVLGERVNALAPARLRHREVVTERGFWYRLSHLVMRRPATIAIATATLLIAAGLPFTQIKFTGVDASVLPTTSAPRQVHDALRSRFDPGRTAPLHVAVSAPRGDAGELRAYAQRLGRLDGAEDAAPPRYVAERTWQIEVVAAAPALDERSQDLVRAVRDAPAPGPVQVAGETAQFVDQQAGLGDRLPWALVVLGLTTLLILFAMTGSVVLPIKALVMNLLGLSATFGLLVLVFQDGRLESLLDYSSQGALESTQPLVLLAIAFGLSTDYGVFLLTRIKEARDAGASNEEAVAIGLQRTGRIVTAAALLLVVAIGAFATSEIVFIKQLGVGTAAAVLIDATIVRALLVPALMKLLGDRNWWAPRPLARLHARLRLGEG